MDNHHEVPNVESAASKNFVPPRHWIGPEELEASYWNDSKVQEKRAQEFFEKPVEWVDQIDRLDKKGIVRRDFLTVMGASMAMASFACARRPVNKIIPYVVKPEEITPGVPNWYASTSQECSAGCGILIKNREGRPIKLEGNPDHPLNQGRLCARCQASLLNLYDPERLKAPVSRVRSSGAQREMSWGEVDTAIQNKLKDLAVGSGRVRILSGQIKGDSTRRVIKEFLSAFKSGSHVEYEPIELEEVSVGQGLSYGTEVIPSYHFDRANYVLSIGSDFLGNGLSHVEHSRAWAKNRRLNGQNAAHAKMSKLVTFESTLTSTGANADERFPVAPGSEHKIAAAIAYELLIRQGRSSFANDSTIRAVLETYKTEDVVQDAQVESGAAVIQKVAADLWENRGKGIVIAGSIQTKTEGGIALQVIVNLLNSALENEGSTIDGTFSTSAAFGKFSAVEKLVDEMKTGQVDALIVYASNPVYTLSSTSLRLEEAMKRVPLVISVTDRVDETGLLADYVLPDHHFLENWGDANPRKGIYSLQQPAMAPIHSSRAFQDSLITWGKGAKLGWSGLASRSKDWHDFLQNNWKETHYKEVGTSASFDQFWEGALRKGVFISRSAQNGKAVPRSFKSASFANISKFSKAKETGLQLVLYAKSSMYDGRSANNAWLQEMPDPISSITWDNYLNVSPQLAKSMGLQEDDVVELTLGGQKTELPVHVQPGMHPNAVSAAVGYGRKAVGKVGNGAGVDVFPFVKVWEDRALFAGFPVTLRKTGRFYKLASTQWHTATENRPVINDITLAQYRKNPAAAQHTDPHLRLDTVPTMWPKHEYKTYRWGMAIDLNACSGCGACVIACQVENNVPVVGRDQVRVARNMHWLRIDRYYSGSPQNPDVVFQPMLCQHCENAPCETVCPVLATVHDDEGLNVQVYNRCVGTRYCQNNCPYKVRRFNFFDHWKAYEGTMNLAWNPDVTVRTRGIMEKCTFCTQRIREAKDKAKDAHEKVRDGDFQVACQQTCPTDAIIFGDMNDPNSRVSKLKGSPHTFRVLEVLNTRPAISYTSKVRNKVGDAHSHGGAHHE